MIRLRVRHVAVLSLLGASLAGCANSLPQTPTPSTPAPPLPDSAVSSAAEVSIDNFAFNPQTLVVTPGTRVHWTNRDDVPHTVTSSDKRFEGSTALDTDDTFSMTFPNAGSYPYYCAVHPHMTATVLVK